MPFVDIGPGQRVFHFPNPGFDAAAVPTDKIRENRSKISTQCVTCFKHPPEGKGFNLCGGCKMAYYCSKQCQKDNWPVHKLFCKSGGQGLNISKLINSLIANNVLRLYLEATLVAQFNLLSRLDKNDFNDKPLLATAQISFEPKEKLHLLQILSGADTDDDELTGMLQITSIHPEPPSPFEKYELTRAELWRNCVTQNKGAPVVMVEFKDLDRPQGYTVALPISAEAFYRTKVAEPFITVSALTGARHSVPFSDYACIEQLNLHIRHDTNNQLRLHMKLRKVDIEIIRGLRETPLKPLSKLFQDKVRREYTYHLLGIGHKDVADMVKGGSGDPEKDEEEFNKIFPEGQKSVWMM